MGDECYHDHREPELPAGNIFHNRPALPAIARWRKRRIRNAKPTHTYAHIAGVPERPVAPGDDDGTRTSAIPTTPALAILYLYSPVDNGIASGRGLPYALQGQRIRPAACLRCPRANVVDIEQEIKPDTRRYIERERLRVRNGNLRAGNGVESLPDSDHALRGACTRYNRHPSGVMRVRYCR